MLQVEAGDVIVKVNDVDVLKYSIKEGKEKIKRDNEYAVIYYLPHS